MRRQHPGWGPRTILFWLERAGVEPLPGRTSVERCLIRHGLVSPQARRRKRSDYKRWERARAMELWQMDIVGGVRLAEGSEAKIVSGIDDHSRFVISAAVVERATARPVCDALEAAIARHGAPEAILTDNGKVFTARFGPGPGPVLFDRICRDNGIDHLLTAPRSPTTTGKIERWHKTLRSEFLNGKVFASITDAQERLDQWVKEYNHERPHQSIGRVPPNERFKLAGPAPTPAPPACTEATSAEPVTTRRVSAKGTIGFATATYKAGAWLAGQTVEVACDGGLVQLWHRGAPGGQAEVGVGARGPSASSSAYRSVGVQDLLPYQLTEVGGELLLGLTLLWARKDHRGLCLGRLLCHLCLLSVSRSVCQGRRLIQRAYRSGEPPHREGPQKRPRLPHLRAPRPRVLLHAGDITRPARPQPPRIRIRAPHSFA